jgi:4-amino-4-deoxy-L-arabinose transferase-like glycosyltransferase
VLLFVAVTIWWLSRNRGIPVYDAGTHLSFAIDAYEALSSGRLLSALTGSVPYPPLVHLVGALGVFIGGIGVVPPVIALNLVFVPLLVLGCYKAGCLAFSPLAGWLAVVFVLGSPMMIEEFHELLLDAPEAAMVAVALWAILATERFLRVKISALAGVAVGLGMLTKETFVLFIIGVTLAAAVRGGRRAWRGIAVFAAVALVITLPWYLYELSVVHSLAGEAFGSTNPELVRLGVAPPRLSLTNLEWYFWSFLNWQLDVPLFAFAAVGWIWMMAGFVRRRPVSALAPELAVGALVTWIALTETYVHDPRYGIPIVVYPALFAAGWVSRLPRAARSLLAVALVLVAAANSLGVGFGVGRTVAIGAPTATYQQPGRLTFYAASGLWLGAPAPEGNMLGLLRTLRRRGVLAIRWSSPSEDETVFSFAGIIALARIARLGVASESIDPLAAGRDIAFLRHGPLIAGLPPPCTTLQGDLGVWVRLGGSRSWSYCSGRRVSPR